MFNQNTPTDTKIAVLEERLSSYELMIKKIDEAIQIMGKTSHNISKMLAVHEEKIENCTRSDTVLFDKIRDLQTNNTEEHNKVIKKFDSLEEKIDERIDAIDKKVEDITKFRWLLVGALIIISFTFSQSSVVVDILTPQNSQLQMEKNK